MTGKAVGWAFDQPIPATEKLVLVALADAANDDGECWPGQRRLAEKTSLARETANRLIACLVGRRLICKERQFRDDGSERSCRYLLALEGGVIKGHTPVIQDHDPCMPGSHQETPRETPLPKYKRAREEEPEKKSTKRECKTSLPGDFPSAKEHDWALRHWEGRARLDLNPIEQGEAFRDHHLKTGGRFIDWEAAWRQWARRAVEYTRQPFGAPGAAGGAANGGSGVPHKSWLDERTEEAIRKVRARANDG